MKNVVSEMLYAGVGMASRWIRQYQQAETTWYLEGEKKIEEWQEVLLRSIETALIATGLLRPEQMPDVNTWDE